MSCAELIAHFDQLVQKVGRHRLNDFLEEVKRGYPVRVSGGLLTLINFLNRDDFHQCIKEMQKHTTNPSWFDLLGGFEYDPIFRSLMLDRYRNIGLNEKFIDLIHYPSGRIRIDMRSYLRLLNVPVQYYVPKIHEYILSSLPEVPYLSNAPDGLLFNVFIPVLRYQKGMSGYLTVIDNNEEEKNWCGTFYYFEPDSNVYLLAPKVLVTWNKITACSDLGIPFETVADAVYLAMENYMSSDENDNEFETFPENIGYNVEGETKREQWDNVVRGFQNRSLDPLKHVPEFYAVEDAFDQMICSIAKSEGIDVIVLKYMTGETRTVCEVLDTRDRVHSFQHLYFPPFSNSFQDRQTNL